MFTLRIEFKNRFFKNEKTLLLSEQGFTTTTY